MENSINDHFSLPDEPLDNLTEEDLALLDDDEEEEQDFGPSNETVSALMENLKVMVKERDEARDGMLRAMADLQNFRRRAQQEKDQLRVLATEQLVQRLIPVLDNFERTLYAVENGASLEALTEGVKGIDRQLRSALESVGLKRDSVVGQSFDPVAHEAIGTVETHEVEENTITDELEAGYRMGDAIIRPAKVRVSVKP